MVNRSRRWLCWAALACLGSSGCAVYDPYRVWRFGFDFNTERQLAGYVATYEHLPPRPVRMRLTKWAYNVGPSQTTAGLYIPADATTQPAVPPPDGVPPGSGDDLLEQAQPPTILPDLPPVPSPSAAPQFAPDRQPGPTAARPGRVRSASYTTTPADPSAAWLFATP